MAGFLYYLLNNGLYKIFIHTYFRSVQIIGLDRVPEEGPLMICANHNNQFFDALLIQSTLNSTNTGFIMAAKSYRQPLIGHFGRLMGSIPVERPQDLAKNGTGTIEKIYMGKITGKNTKFTQELKEQYTISLKIGDQKQDIIVKEILNDNEFTVASILNDHYDSLNTPFKIIPKLDQKQMFQTVWDALNHQKKRIIIFPEGGSHDQTDLLPLKPGVCIMALGAMEQSGKPVKILPCGLNYYKGHKFRSKVLIEFGHPYTIPMELLELYKKNKREAVEILLKLVENHMRSVMYSAPSYRELSAIILARKLYMPDQQKISSGEELELNKRFSKGYSKFKNDEKIKEFYNHVLDYRKNLSNIGIEDYQLRNFKKNFFFDLLAFLKYLVLTLASFSFALPGLLVNTPIGILIKYLSEQERKKCLKSSTVKLRGNDVVASYRLKLTFQILPLYWLLTSLVTYLISKTYLFPNNPRHQKLATLLYMLLSPFYAFIMLKSTDRVFRYTRNLLARVRLLFSYNDIKNISQQRKKLQEKIRELVEKLGKDVVENFDENRIIKQDKLNKNSNTSPSPSRLNILKSEKFELNFEDLIEIGL